MLNDGHGNTFQIRYGSETDSMQQNAFGLTPFLVPAYSKPLLSFYRETRVFQNPDHSYRNITIFNNFNRHVYLNPFIDLYLGGYQKLLLYGQFVDNLALMRYDASGAFLSLPQSDYVIDSEVWYSDTLSIAFSDNLNPATNASSRFTVFFCAGQLRYSQKTRSCVTADDCVAGGQFIQGSICSATCPLYTTSDGDHHCYFTCPVWRGYANPTDGSKVCPLCNSTTQLATSAGCVTQVNCSAGSYKMGLGCFEECPYGTNLVGGVCVQP